MSKTSLHHYRRNLAKCIQGDNNHLVNAVNDKKSVEVEMINNEQYFPTLLQKKGGCVHAKPSIRNTPMGVRSYNSIHAEFTFVHVKKSFLTGIIVVFSSFGLNHIIYILLRRPCCGGSLFDRKEQDR